MFPSVLRGGYELGERVIHKDERSWRQILDQTLEQLSPIAPSSVLIQSESAYIYHFDGRRFVEKLGGTKMAFIGNPRDQTVQVPDGAGGMGGGIPLQYGVNKPPDGGRPAGPCQSGLEPHRLPAHRAAADQRVLPASRRADRG